jgi:hypothetical protein
VGLLLSCNHIYNQYVILDNSDDNLQRFEKSSRNMQALSRYSRSNAINSEWIEEYLNEAHSGGLVSVRAHYNVIAWSDDGEELKRAKNDIGSQLASMECMPRHNTGGRARHSIGLESPAIRRTSLPRKVSYLHRAGYMPLHRGNELPQFALALRDQDGGQADGEAPAP